MALPDIFTPEVHAGLIRRIQSLTPTTQPLWGKMTVSKMLAHCCVTYEMVYETKHPKPNFFMGILLKLVVKGAVTNEKPYKKNLATAPQFIIKDDRDFAVEQKRLIDYLNRTQALGPAHFDGKTSHSFGPLTRTEWNNMFYKHLDHHLSQFGV